MTNQRLSFGTKPLRGGRLTKWKGRVASLSPQIGTLVLAASVSVPAVMTGSAALAQCMNVGPFVGCSGTTNQTKAVVDPPSGLILMSDGFTVDTTAVGGSGGPALDFSATSGSLSAQANGTPPGTNNFTGATDGVQFTVQGGASTDTATFTLEQGGITAEGGTGFIGDLDDLGTATLSFGSAVSGTSSGFRAEFTEVGTVALTFDGDVTGETDDGIFASSNGTGGPLDLTVGEGVTVRSGTRAAAGDPLTGGSDGIGVDNVTTAPIALTIGTGVTVEGTNDGVDIGSIGSVIVAAGADAAITGDDTGIEAYVYGDGDISVTLGDSAMVDAGYDGIFAEVDNDGSIDVTLGDRAIIDAGGDGVEADLGGDGTVSVMVGAGATITATDSGVNADVDRGGSIALTVGDRTSIDAGDFGLFAYLDRDDASVTVGDGVTIDAGRDGIFAANHDDGTMSITVGDDVTITADDDGIFTEVDGDGDATVTVGANALITGGDNGINTEVNDDGDIAITVSDGSTVVGDDAGIYAQVGYIGNITVEVGADSTVSGYDDEAIYAVKFGDGDITVTVGDRTTLSSDYDRGVYVDVSAYDGDGKITLGDDVTVNADDDGLYVYGYAADSTMTITAGDRLTVTAGEYGVYAQNVYGTAVVEIGDDATITAGYDGVYADTYQGDVTVTLGDGADVSGGTDGIDAGSYGGDVTVSLGDDADIEGYEVGLSGYSGQGSVTVTGDGGGTIEGGYVGVSASVGYPVSSAASYGEDLTVDIGADVVGEYAGIVATNYSADGDTVVRVGGARSAQGPGLAVTAPYSTGDVIVEARGDVAGTSGVYVGSQTSTGEVSLTLGGDVDIAGTTSPYGYTQFDTGGIGAVVVSDGAAVTRFAHTGGTITPLAGQDGVDVISDGSTTTEVSLGGTIASDGTGVDIDAATGSVLVTATAGSVTRGGPAGIAVDAAGDVDFDLAGSVEGTGGGVTVDTTGDVVGRIADASASAGVGLGVESGGGDVSLEIVGEVTGSLGGVGVDTGGGGEAVEIEIAGTVDSSAGPGITVTAGSDVSITVAEGGTLGGAAGAVRSLGGDTSFEVSVEGTVTADADLGGLDDTFLLIGDGALAPGVTIRGGDADTVDLFGFIDWEGGIAPPQIDGFEQIALTEGSKVTLGAGALGGDLLAIEDGSALQLGGDLTFRGDVGNFGRLDLSSADPGVGTRFRIGGDFGGAGDLIVDADLSSGGGGSNRPGAERARGDQLLIAGDALGETRVTVVDVGPGGARSTDRDGDGVTDADEGILFAQVEGRASAGAFVLADGPLVAGELQFDVEAFRPGRSESGEWDFVLASSTFAPALAVTSAPVNLLAVLSVSDFATRQLSADATVVDEFGGPSEPFAFAPQRRAWAYVTGTTGDREVGGRGAVSDYTSTGLYVGATTPVEGLSGGELALGAELFVLNGRADVTDGTVGAGVDMDALGVNLIGTWFDDSGVYVEGQVQLSNLDVELSAAGAASQTDGRGRAVSVEVGRPYALSPRSQVTPRGQLVYSQVSLDDYVGATGERVSFDDAETLELRAGARFDMLGDAPGSRYYVVADVSHQFRDETVSRVNGVAIATELDDWTAEVGFGGTFAFDETGPLGMPGQIFGEVTAETDFDGGMQIGAQLGVRFEF
ncbi:MAG: autotransporter outer membrane beta-barrel domain-containing protein [Paracoccaceae bacterium]